MHAVNYLDRVLTYPLVPTDLHGSARFAARVFALIDETVSDDSFSSDRRRFPGWRVHIPMPFQPSWHTLLEECDALGDGATLTTPLTDNQFRITSVQDPRIVIEFVDTSDSQPLQRDQFEALAGRITDAGGTFELQRLPPDAEPYAAVLSLHPRYECNERAGTLTETDDPTSAQLITGASPAADEQAQDRTEPDLDIFEGRIGVRVILLTSFLMSSWITVVSLVLILSSRPARTLAGVWIHSSHFQKTQFNILH